MNVFVDSTNLNILPYVLDVSLMEHPDDLGNPVNRYDRQDL